MNLFRFVHFKYSIFIEIIKTSLIDILPTWLWLKIKTGIMCINNISINISSFLFICFGWLSTMEETFLFVGWCNHVLKLVLHNWCCFYQNRCLSLGLNWFLFDTAICYLFLIRVFVFLILGTDPLIWLKFLKNIG